MKFSKLVKNSQFLCITLMLGMAMPLPILSDELDEVTELAINTLNDLQEISFKAKREYCGWIVDNGDNLVALPARPGQIDSCEMEEPPSDVVILSSYHTHANYNAEYDSEVVSPDDLLGDIEDEVYGFVGTPGGRVWLNDPYQEESFLICEQCIVQDPQYKEDYDYPIQQSYNVEEIEERLGLE